MLMKRVTSNHKSQEALLSSGEIIQMHTIQQSNGILIILPGNGNWTAKKQQNTIQFIEVIKHNQCDRCTWWFLHRL